MSGPGKAEAQGRDPLLLNVYADAVVAVDRVGGIEEFLAKVRRRARP